ncbi:hypothetical protein CYLTODRAFT_459477 [Cylindrobasidium torrendii FP15055 ss-10]|uniref:Wings apart-like protein C-terminal domain-containing protein n=1 Tax=Cylindrobasidium torrendii FP15055 ss-10 TaxID=1314674 RepID=A0A0D7AVJ6_9AGAR|nr:hypothetical protein CYLTODRAFT_459477 [Cylindrobasidium torrendii FP15055 ss-10]
MSFTSKDILSLNLLPNAASLGFNVKDHSPTRIHSSSVISHGSAKESTGQSLGKVAKRTKGKPASKKRHGSSILLSSSSPVTGKIRCRPASELRRQGELRNAGHDLQYMLDGLSKKFSIGLRHDSAARLCNRLYNASFLQHLKTAGLLRQLYDAFLYPGVDEDDSLRSLVFSYFCCRLLSDQHVLLDFTSPSDRLHASALVRRLLAIGIKTSAGRNPGAAWGNEADEETLLAQVHSGMLDPKENAVTTTILISKSLVLLPTNLLDSDHFLLLLGLLRSFVSSANYQATSNFLRSLEAFLLGEWPLCADNDAWRALEEAKDEWLLDDLVACIIRCENVDGRVAQACAEAVFRVLVNFTQRSPSWCQLLHAHRVAISVVVRVLVRTDSTRYDRRTPLGQILHGSGLKLDTFCLCIGLLTNIIQQDTNVGGKMRHLHAGFPSDGSQLQCFCPAEDGSALDVLGTIYLRQKLVAAANKRPGDPQFLLGHLAVLLGLLMCRSHENAIVIMEGLEKRSVLIPRKKVAAGMIEDAKGLAAFYQTLRREPENARVDGVVEEVVAFLQQAF